MLLNLESLRAVTTVIYIICDKTMLHLAWKMIHLREIDEQFSKSEKKDNLIGILT